MADINALFYTVTATVTAVLSCANWATSQRIRDNFKERNSESSNEFKYKLVVPIN